MNLKQANLTKVEHVHPLCNANTDVSQETDVFLCVSLFIRKSTSVSPLYSIPVVFWRALVSMDQYGICAMHVQRSDAVCLTLKFVLRSWADAAAQASATASAATATRMMRPCKVWRRCLASLGSCRTPWDVNT